MPVPAQIPVKDANGLTVNANAPLNPGRAPATDSRPTAACNEDFAVIGALTEAAPGTDTASSGLNGRLQRIAQRLSSLIAQVPSSLGIKTAAASLSITHASDDAVLAILQSNTPSPVTLPGDWNTAAASTTQALGAAGVIGDYLSHVTITPTSLSPGAVQIKDGTGGGAVTYTIFAGGASSLTNLVPFAVALGMNSKVGGWSIITNAGATAAGVGDFT